MFAPIQWAQPAMQVAQPAMSFVQPVQFETVPIQVEQVAIQPQVEQYVPEPPRIPQRRREVIRVPGPAGQTRQIVKRLPAPQPDVIERVTIVQPQQDIVNVIIERPSTPPPQIIEKRIVERAQAPIVNHRLVRLPAPPAPQPIQAPVQYAPAQPQQQQWSPCGSQGGYY